MKILKYLTIFLILLSIILAQNSSFTIVGSGTVATSAHITITTNAYQCADDGYVVQNGATLTIWDGVAICGCKNGSIIYNTETGKFNFCENGIWVEK